MRKEHPNISSSLMSEMEIELRVEARNNECVGVSRDLVEAGP